MTLDVSKKLYLKSAVTSRLQDQLTGYRDDFTLFKEQWTRQDLINLEIQYLTTSHKESARNFVLGKDSLLVVLEGMMLRTM
jgi:hypothetical protein